MIDGMNEARIDLDLPPSDHLDAARHADPRLVVAVDVGAHRQLAFILGRVEQFADALGVLERVAPARDRAADRTGLDAPALDPHVHFRRRRNEKLALSEIDQRAVGRRIGPTQPSKDNTPRASAPGAATGRRDDPPTGAPPRGAPRLPA